MTRIMITSAGKTFPFDVDYGTPDDLEAAVMDAFYGSSFVRGRQADTQIPAAFGPHFFLDSIITFGSTASVDPYHMSTLRVIAAGTVMTLCTPKTFEDLIEEASRICEGSRPGRFLHAFKRSGEPVLVGPWVLDRATLTLQV
jgi:hypothetical protein